MPDDCMAELQVFGKHRKVQVVSKVLDLGTTELNNMVQYIGYVGVYMSVLLMFILHNIQQDAFEEIKAHEHTVCEQLKKVKNIVYLLHIYLQDKENQAQKWQQDRK